MHALQATLIMDHTCHLVGSCKELWELSNKNYFLLIQRFQPTEATSQFQYKIGIYRLNRSHMVYSN